MPKSLKPKLLSQALVLHAEGVRKAVIAKSLKVTVRTVERWLQQEHSPGLREVPDAAPAARAPSNSGPPPPADELVRVLQNRLARLIEQSENEQKDAGIEDRMLKVCRVLESLRAGSDDLAAQLEAMKKFADFCVSTLSEDEMGPVRKAVRLFLEKLRRDNS